MKSDDNKENQDPNTKPKSPRRLDSLDPEKEKREIKEKEGINGPPVSMVQTSQAAQIKREIEGLQTKRIVTKRKNNENPLNNDLNSQVQETTFTPPTPPSGDGLSSQVQQTQNGSDSTTISQTTPNLDLNRLGKKYDAANVMNNVLKNVNTETKTVPTLESLSNSLNDQLGEGQNSIQEIVDTDSITLVNKLDAIQEESGDIETPLTGEEKEQVATFLTQVGDKLDNIQSGLGVRFKAQSSSILGPEERELEDVKIIIDAAIQNTLEATLTDDQKSEAKVILDPVQNFIGKAEFSIKGLEELGGSAPNNLTDAMGQAVQETINQDITLTQEERKGFAGLFSGIGNKFSKIKKSLGDRWTSLSDKIAGKENVTFDGLMDGFNDAVKGTSEEVSAEDSNLTNDEKSQASSMLYKLSEYMRKESLIAEVSEVGEKLGINKAKGEKQQGRSKSFRDRTISKILNRVSTYFNSLTTPNQEEETKDLEEQQKTRLSGAMKAVGDNLKAVGDSLKETGQTAADNLEKSFNEAAESINSRAAKTYTQATEFVVKASKETYDKIKNIKIPNSTQVGQSFNSLLKRIENEIDVFSSGPYDLEAAKAKEMKVKEVQSPETKTEEKVDVASLNSSNESLDTKKTTIEGRNNNKNKQYEEQEIRNARQSQQTQPPQQFQTQIQQPQQQFQSQGPQSLGALPNNMDYFDNPHAFKGMRPREKDYRDLYLEERLHRMEDKLRDMEDKRNNPAPQEPEKKPMMSNDTKVVLLIACMCLLFGQPVLAMAVIGAYGAYKTAELIADKGAKAYNSFKGPKDKEQNISPSKTQEPEQNKTREENKTKEPEQTLTQTDIKSPTTPTVNSRQNNGQSRT